MKTKKQTTAVPDKLIYPLTRAEKVKEILHGQVVTDPYRWLEDDNSEEVKRWTEEQNKFTMSCLEKLPCREKIKNRLTELWNYPKISPPRKFGRYYFFTKNDGLQNQAVLYVQKGLKGKAKVVIDPNTLNEAGTTCLDYYYPSEDGSLMVYGLSCRGDENSTLYVKDVVSGKDFPEVINDCRYSSVAWDLDNKGFYYTPFNCQDLFHQKILYHCLQTDPKEDKLIYQNNEEDKAVTFDVELSKDGHYLLIMAGLGACNRNELYLIDLWENNKFIPVVKGFKHQYLAKIVKDRLFILTNEDAPCSKLMTTSLKDPQRENWQTVVFEQKYPLDEFAVINNKLALHYLYNAHSRLKIYSLSGKLLKEVKLPTMGSVLGISGKAEHKEMFFTFSSFAYPPVIYRYNFQKSKLLPFYKTPVNINVNDYQLKQVWYKSKDGTKVSMFITAKKGLQLNGENPVLLNGYGGFNITFAPIFSVSRYIWLENGGVLAVSNLRGGGEYGEKWHQAAMQEKKQNCFDDFIYAGKWLIAEKYTNKDKLAIQGGSNGGLLVGAVMTQCPDLCKAVVCAVPLLDMVRYHQFLIARYWIPEYGSAEDSEQFKYLYAYSPYHNVKDKTPYPATFIITAEADSRVAPLHARKMAARLQKATSSDRPILLFIENNAGHGCGKPTCKAIEEATNIWTFIFWQLQA